MAITVRDVPDGFRDELAARAARTGQSLQEYLRGLLVATADKPTVDEVLARAGACRCHGSPSRCRRHTHQPGRRPPVTDRVALAYADLLDLNVTAWPYEVLGGRIWQLLQHLTSYDAAYVALAETLSATLITLDRRIARAPGIGCAIASRR